LILNLFIGFFLNKFLNKPQLIHESSVPEKYKKTPSDLNSKSSTIIWLFMLLFFFPFFSALLQSSEILLNQKNFFILKELWPPFLKSFLISFICFFFSFLFGFLCLIAKQESLLIRYSNILSPPFILFGWLEIGIHPENSFCSIFYVSFASFICVFPWFYRQLKNQRDQLPKEAGVYCLSIGMSPYVYFRKVLFPQHKGTLFKLSGVSSLWAFGDFVFSKVFFDRSETLPLTIEENLRRYNFDTSSIGISLAYLGSFLIIFLLFKSERVSSC